MPSLSKLLSRKLNIFLLRTSNNEYKKSLEKIDKYRKMVSTDEAARDGLKKVLQHLESKPELGESASIRKQIENLETKILKNKIRVAKHSIIISMILQRKETRKSLFESALKANVDIGEGPIEPIPLRG